MLSFAQRIAAWQQCHGRNHLPWQSHNPYHVWLSEIMLQQTQVATVLQYYPRFIARFPDIQALAAAATDDVLALWSGLGYYSRARNLHNAAQQIMHEYNGLFPYERAKLETLKGVGRSTAAAIAVFAFGQKEAILDGNVKRLLTRHAGIYGATDRPTTLTTLWREAEERLPDDSATLRRYTQGLMDLGNSTCTRSKPRCAACPVAADCYAYRHDKTTELPTKRQKKIVPEKETVMLLAHCGDRLHLYRRPDHGIWRGLWSFPEFDSIATATHAAASLGTIAAQEPLSVLTHKFTHYTLHIQPLAVRITTPYNPHNWLPHTEALAKGLPAPVRRLIMQYPLAMSDKSASCASPLLI
ncbi:MAG: A/G-specific adenine glycosylase [Cardiobacteriaceae bacterium]|nr:A/G-specific adenine glycosylase [Cardiobacteriaceae bacterium]